MNTRTLIPSLSVVAIAMAGATAHAEQAHSDTSAAPRSPNIVFIYADDMSWTGSSVAMIQGDPSSRSDFYQTPNLEALAATGMVFSNAYSPGALCTPSRAGLLTGQTPAQLRITTPGRGKVDDSRKVLTPQPTTQLPPSITTIGTALKTQGYATALLGKWHIGREDHAGRFGFDQHDEATQNDNQGTPQDPKEIFSLTQRGIEFIEQSVNANQPFYLQISHYAVHSPTQSRPESRDKFNALAAGQYHSDPDYAGMTWDLDTSLAPLLQALDDLGISDNTYVVFSSDHGAPGNRRNPYNAPLFGGKGSLYEGGIRVPLIISGPGVNIGYSDKNVSGTDLFATFASWAGAKVDAPESEDLTPLLTDNDDKFQRRHALLFHYPHYGRGSQTPQTALIADQWKLLRDWEQGSDQLFNLKEDIGETQDLADKEPKTLAKMIALMDARLTNIEAQLPIPNSDYDPNVAPRRRGNRR
ncbi:sulfatase [Ferrimonas pelagia]|uniref:Sulfatase n=1 Tax=Ferrimonas pelagia TaxID=1177826 RepID=A0ABP9ERQ2_9GAMM